MHILTKTEGFYFRSSHSQQIYTKTNRKKQVQRRNGKKKRPESMSFSKVRTFVNCICSSADIFAAWSSTSGYNLLFDYFLWDHKTNQKSICSELAPFIWKRKAFMYCKYSSIFFRIQIPSSGEDRFRNSCDSWRQLQIEKRGFSVRINLEITAARKKGCESQIGEQLASVSDGQRVLFWREKIRENKTWEVFGIRSSPVINSLNTSH